MGTHETSVGEGDGMTIWWLRSVRAIKTGILCNIDLTHKWRTCLRNKGGKCWWWWPSVWSEECLDQVCFLSKMRMMQTYQLDSAQVNEDEPILAPNGVGTNDKNHCSTPGIGNEVMEVVPWHIYLGRYERRRSLSLRSQFWKTVTWNVCVTYNLRSHTQYGMTKETQMSYISSLMFLSWKNVWLTSVERFDEKLSEKDI